MLLAALQRDRELAGVSREEEEEGRGGVGLKDTEKGGVQEKPSSIGLPAIRAGQCGRRRGSAANGL